MGKLFAQVAAASATGSREIGTGTLTARSSSAEAADTRVLRVLSVCTGNICRSPVAEAVWQGWAGRVPGLQSASAGVRAVIGAPMEASAYAVSRHWWSGARDFSARQIDAHEIASADLVLVMSRSQRHEVLRLDPTALHRTFLVRELDAILAGSVRHAQPPSVGAAMSPGEMPDDEFALVRARRLLAGASRQRHIAGRAGDVPDPYRLAPDRQDAILTELARYVDRIAGRLFGR